MLFASWRERYVPVDVLELIKIVNSCLLGTCALEVGTSSLLCSASHREAGSWNLLPARSYQWEAVAGIWRERVMVGMSHVRDCLLVLY